MKTSLTKNLLCAVSLAAGICLAGNLQAAEIQGVSIAAVSAQYSSPPDIRFATNLVSNIGLFGDTHSDIGPGDMWLSLSGGPLATNFVTFNLGGLYTVNAMKVWNYDEAASSEYLTRGLSNASISYSTDGINFTTNIPVQGFNRAPGTYSAFPQFIQMPSPVVAQYIRIDVITNYGVSASGVGLSKVRFISNTNLLTVLSASENYGSNQITVYFAESVDTNTATQAANYSIAGSGATVISNVTMGEYPDRVILSTSPLTNANYSVTVSGVYDEALTAAASATVPVQSEVFLWLMANQGVQTNASGMLTAWNDQSTYGHNAGPTNLGSAYPQYASQPYLAANTLNGMPTVQFFGTNVMAVPNDPNNPINGDMTLFLVFDKTSVATAYGDVMSKTGGDWSGGHSNSLPAPWDFYINTTGKPYFSTGNANGGTAPQSVTAAAAISMNSFYITAVQIKATTAAIYLNGNLDVSAAFAAPQWDGGNPIFIGMRSDAYDAVTFTGYLAEALLLRGTVTTSDFSKVNAYLGAKYNIPVPTLGITEEPASLTAQVGKQATFWVNAVGPPPLTYQWKSNSVAISGGTSAVYTTPALTSSANNASYTVTVTSPVGSANSTAAILTVVPDTTPPTVFSASETSGLTNVVVVFSESVSNTSALNTANYAITGGVSILSAAVGSSSNQVRLTTSAMSTSALYSMEVQNVQDFYNNTMTATNVPIMPAGMTMWLRGGSGIVTNASAANPAAVDAWLDQTANSNNATTYSSGPAYRPSVGADAVDGAPTLLFNASSSNYLSVASSSGTALTGDMTIYAVANFSDYSGWREIVGKTTSTQPNPYDFNTTTGGSGILRFLRGNGTAGAVANSTAAPALQIPQVITVTMQGTTVNQYLNGLGNGAATLSTATTDSGQPLIIGSRSILDIFMNGDISELMLFSNAISGAARTNIDNYLGVKYFPFTVTQAPDNYTTNEGETATFSVACSQGSAHFTYQWIENSTNIPGATNPSYTTGILAPSDNGDTFSVIVTLESSTNVVGPATLTVNNVPPTVLSAGTAVWNGNSIIVIFSEGVDPSSALNPANYVLNNGATVLSVTMLSPTEIVLTTSALTQGTSYSLTVQNVQDDYGNTVVTTTVPNGHYPPALALWLRADEGVSAPGGNVQEWDDQSGNGNDFYAGFSPTLVTNAINGLPAVQFDATNETYMGANDSPSLELTGDMTIFAVINFTTYATNGIGYGQGGGEIISKMGSSLFNYPAPYDYYVLAGDGPLDFLRGNGSSYLISPATITPSTGVTHLMDVMMQGNTIYHRLDGQTNGTLTGSTPIADQGLPVYIGTREDGNERLDGDMAEIIMFGSALSTNDVNSIESYLATKYGLVYSPLLNVTESNGNVVISWQTTEWAFVLQATPSLAASVWSAVTNAPAATNGTSTVTIPAGGSQMFYRLQSQ